MLGDQLRSLVGAVRDIGRSGAVALADQAVVSGTSFSTTIILGRLTGPSELGLYSLAVTLALFAAVLQEALVTLPYTIFGRRLEGTPRRRYAGTSLLLCGALALIAVASGLVAMGLSSAGFLASHLEPALALCTLIVPMFLLREFARRFLFAELRMAQALQLDAGVATLHLLALFALASAGALSARTAAFGSAGAAAVVVAAWYWQSRSAFTIGREDIRSTVVQNWQFGQWVLVGRVVSLLNSDVLMLWLIALLVNPAASGTFTACLAIVFFSNPFVLGVANLVGPKIAHAYAEGGPTAAGRAVTQSTWIIAAPLVAFCLLVWLFAGRALQVLYGNAYVGQEATVVVLALGTLASALGLGASNGLWVLGRPKANTVSSGLGLVVTLSTASVLVPMLHILGAALGLLVGQGAESLTRNLLFRHYVRVAQALDTLPAAVPCAETVVS